MTSEKWFDWDNSEQGQGSSPASSTEEQPAESQALDPSIPPLEGENPDPSSQAASPDFDPPPAEIPAATETPETFSPSLEPTPPVEAMRPFHLWITGELKPHEKDRLTDLLARENFGIREVDLELQFEAGKILLPRISEYAAVLVAQSLRGALVEFQLLPSEMAAQGERPQPTPRAPSRAHAADDLQDHPAEKLPVTQEQFLPGHENALPLDHLIATGLIREPEWKAESSDSYSQIIEALKRELRFKAYLKKADALVRFESKILPSPWISERECRVQVSALAVRFSH